METINIKGKEYVTVDERLKHFRANYPDASLISELISNEDGVCVFKATIFLNDKVVATGHAYEKEGSTFINKTSYIENCETSAWGRALANLGVGLTGSVASADEVQNAILNQEPRKLSKQQINASLDIIAKCVEDSKEESKLDASKKKARALFKRINDPMIEATGRTIIIDELIKHYPEWAMEIKTD